MIPHITRNINDLLLIVPLITNCSSLNSFLFDFRKNAQYLVFFRFTVLEKLEYDMLFKKRYVCLLVLVFFFTQMLYFKVLYMQLIRLICKILRRHVILVAEYC